MSQRPSSVAKNAQLAEFFQAMYGTYDFQQKIFLVTDPQTHLPLPFLQRSIF